MLFLLSTTSSLDGLCVSMTVEIELDLNFNCTYARKFRIVHVRLRIYVIVAALFCLSSYVHADDTISLQAGIAFWMILFKEFPRVFVSYYAIVRHSFIYNFYFSLYPFLNAVRHKVSLA